MSGDGRIVAFESTEDVAGVGGPDSFRAIRANVNVSPTTFVQLAASRAPAPAISQDGSRIVFASTANPLGTNVDGNSEIFLHDGTLRQITNTTPADLSSRTVHGNFLPSISDDGRFIAFSSNRNLAGQNSDGNLEIFVFDNSTSTFTQLTSSSGTVGFTDAKISGNAMNVAYIRDPGSSSSPNRDLLLQNRIGTPTVRVLVSNAPNLQLTHGRAISDDGLRVVWSAETAINSTQVFLFDGRNNQTRQITTLGSRATDVPLHPTISGDGSRIAFATRRTFLGNSDGSVDLYSFDIPSTTFGRVTSGPSNATAEVLSSLNDDGSVVAFNFPRVLAGVTNVTAANNSEIYVTETPSRPANGTLTILNGASFGHEPAASNAVAPDSIAVARGTALAFSSQQSLQQTDGSFPQSVGGTTVTVNGRLAQILYVSPSQVNFLTPAQTELGAAEVLVTNSDGFQSRGNIQTLLAAPGVFTFSGDGLGAGVILNADTLQGGPFDPSNGNLRMVIFTMGVRTALSVNVSAGGRALKVESIDESPTLPGLDEIHVLVPADLRGAGTVDLEVRADGRDGNPVTVMFIGDSARDIVINEFLADPSEGNDGDANHDRTRNASQDEFIELFNSTPRDIDISGYQLFTRGGTSANDVLRHTFAEGTVLQSCTAIIVFGGGNPHPFDPIFGGSQIVTASTGGLSLSNTSGLIALRNESGDFVNFLAYGGSTGLDADENQSLTRAPDLTGAFALHSAASNGARSFSPGTQLTGAPFNSCTPAIARVEVSPATVSIEPGQPQLFTARAFDASHNEINGVIFWWESDNITVATIGQNGNAFGVSPGTAQVRATGRGIRSSPAALTVIQPPSVLTSVTITRSAATIAAGETQQFIAQARDQFGRDFGGVTINFVSNNTAVATVNVVSPTTNTGSATASATARAPGSASITATATSGSTTLISSPAVLTVEPGAGQLLISEFRTRGPAGAADEFIEIYNPTTSTLPIGGLRIRASNSSGTISDRVTIFAGTSLEPGCHYLVANSDYSGSVVTDQTYNTGLTDDGGIAITGSNGTSVIDAVGMSVGSAFREDTTLTPLSGTADRSYERKPGGSFGNGVDTNNNVADFSLTAPSNPQNSLSSCLNTSAAELSITKTASPNPVITGTNVTYSIVVMNKGVAVAQNVVVTDNLPPSVTFVSCSSTGTRICGGSGNNRTITFASLAAGASETITLIATANGAAGTTITNTAAATSNIADPNTANNSSTVTTTVQAPAPGLSINNVAIKEGDAGTMTFSFTVSLSSAAVGDGVTFDIATQDHTATSASGDYVAKFLTGQNIPAGNSKYTFDVIVNGDTLVEPDESFFVNVTNVTGATVGDAQGEGTINNDDNAMLVISQLYGGGGNSGAQFTHDFIEVFNRGTTTVDLTGWSVQYLGATGSGTWSTTSLSGLLQPGQYFLVQENSAGANGAALPAPDAIGSITMAATAGKVALVSSKTPLSGSCPSGASIADVIGYGSTASCFEGSGPAPAASATSADFRKAGGCVDTNNNAADFFVLAPFPRNTSGAFNSCTSGVRPGLTINDVATAEGNGGATVATFTVSLSTPVQGADVTFDIATADGSAQDNNPAASEDGDYVAKFLTNQIIPAGQQKFTFTVTINADTAIETDETFFVNVMNVSGATLTDGQGQGTIQNDDIPTLSINDVSLAEGDSGPNVFTFTVNLSANAPAPVKFDIATAEGTAQTSEDNDYIGRKATAQVIPAGQSTYTFDVTVNGDMDIEKNETFVVNVSNVTGAFVADGQGIGTIQNDDTPSLNLTDVTAAETDAGTTTLTFTVTSTLPAPPDGITFDIATADGTAHDGDPVTEDNDYVAKNLTGQIIPFGQNQYTFDVTVNGDVLVEADETFFVNISNVTNATVSDSQGLGRIQNDDTALVVISQLYGAGGNSSATLRNDFIEIFNRGTSTVDLAGWSVQYTSATGTTWQVTPLCPTGPCLLLPGKYFLVQEAGGANGELLPAADATGSVAMAATAGKVALVSSTTALTGSGCPVGPTVLDFAAYGTTASCFEGTGSAPAPSATNADVRKGGGCVDINNNASDFFLHPPAPRNNGFPANSCNGQKVDLSINDVTVTETDVGTLAATFTVTLHGTTGSAVTVDYSTADDTAIAPGDYDAIPTTQLLFNPGETTRTIMVEVQGDKLDEPNETFFVNLANASNAAILDNLGRGTITDNDVPPALTINDVAINEGNAGTTVFAFTVHLSAPALTGGVTFDIATADGTAQDDNPAPEDSDYVAQGLTSQTIPAGSQDFVFNVIVNGDLNIEPNETFFVNVTKVTGATVSDAQGVALGHATIQNDDSPALSIDDLTANEGNSGTTILTFTVTSSLPAPAGGITFDIATADGTAQDDDPATDDNDYVAHSLTGQTIPEGLTTYTFPVTVNSDAKNEAACETFLVNVTNAINATIVDGQGQGSIIDEDGTKLVISQIYGGGGNASATYTNDFIEIFNRGNTSVSLNGMSVQYASATSTTGSFAVTPLPNVMLQPGQYFLVRQAGGATGIALPTPDATGSINMAAGVGKVALVNGTTALSAVGCPSGPTIIDFVGYGTTANCREGASTADNAPGPSNNTTSAQRDLSGCQDLNNNQQDFATAQVVPRNTRRF